MQNLNGKTALVTGASSGIGRAACLLFLDAGASVVATGRTKAALDALAAETAGRPLKTLAGNLNDAGFVAELVGAAGSVDILLNNAGALKHAAFLESDPADWAPVFEINVLSLLRLTQAVARGMAARGSGHIINISSMLARRVAPQTMVYTASKHAVAAISQGLRMELRPHGIRVTEIAPGVAATNVFRSIEDPALKARYAQAKFTPLTPTQVAEAVLFAARSDPNAGIDLIELKPVGQE